MAVIASKSTTAGTEKFLILRPREALSYPLGFTDWNKIRICMMLSYTNLTQTNADMDAFNTAEVNPASTERDRLFFGLSRGDPTFPREANDVFVGFKSYGTRTYVSFPQTIFDHRNNHGDLVQLGVHHPNGSKEGKLFDDTINQAFALVTPPSSFDETSAFAGALIVYLEVINKGQADQQLSVRYGQTQVTDNSREGLRQHMINTSLTTVGTLAFNQSGVPYELPNSFFIYNPISTIRTRVFGLSAIKEA